MPTRIAFSKTKQNKTKLGGGWPWPASYRLVGGSARCGEQDIWGDVSPLNLYTDYIRARKMPEFKERPACV